MKTLNLKYFGVRILIFMGHVTPSEGDHRTRREHFPIGGQWWPCVYLARIRRYGFKNFGVTSLTFWGHVTSSVTWPLDSPYVVFYWQSIVTMHLSCTVTEIWGSKYIGVTTLTFGGHVTSSITWPSDSAWALSYWWLMMTMRVSCTDMEIQGFKDFGVTWRHQLCDHSTRHMWFPIGGPFYLAPFRRYKASKLHLLMLKAKSSLRMLRVTWPVGGGSKMTTYLKFPSPPCLFTIQLLWGYDDD